MLKVEWFVWLAVNWLPKSENLEGPQRKKIYRSDKTFDINTALQASLVTVISNT